MPQYSEVVETSVIWRAGVRSILVSALTAEVHVQALSSAVRAVHNSLQLRTGLSFPLLSSDRPKYCRWSCYSAPRSQLGLIWRALGSHYNDYSCQRLQRLDQFDRVVCIFKSFLRLWLYTGIFRMKFPTGFTYWNLHGLAQFPCGSTALVETFSLIVVHTSLYQDADQPPSPGLVNFGLTHRTCVFSVRFHRLAYAVVYRPLREADTIPTDSVPTDAIPTIRSQDDLVHL